MKKLLIFGEWEFQKLKLDIIYRMMEIFVQEYNLDIDLDPELDSPAEKKLSEVLNKIEKAIDFKIDNMEDD